MTTADVAKESFQFKRLWRELHNLELSNDKILHRKGDENNQVTLPSRLKPYLKNYMQAWDIQGMTELQNL